jgi:hypothetical protein
MRNKEYAIYVEEFVANGMQIVEIAKKYNTNTWCVSISISKYYGSPKHKLVSQLKPAKHSYLINKYKNLTNLKELYERESNSH